MIRNTSLNQVLVGFAATVIILAGIKLSGEIVVPFLLALFIAIICSPLIKFMTNRKIPHWLAITLLFLLILLVFFFLFGLINNSIREFNQSMPQYKILLAERLTDISTLAKRWNIPFSIEREVISEKFDPSIVMNFARSLLVNFSNVVSNAFVLILVVIFMLLEAPTAKHKFALVFSDNLLNIKEEERNLDLVLEGIIRYLVIKTVVSLATGVCLYILL